MKVSHELPLCLLDKSEQWNDYEFCLPTYWFKSEDYKNYYKSSKRFTIADNGLFEGVTHTTEDLFDKIWLVRPDIFIVPDEWNDSNCDEGTMYADYKIVEMAGTPYMKKRFNEYYELNAGEEYYFEVEQ